MEESAGMNRLRIADCGFCILMIGKKFIVKLGASPQLECWNIGILSFGLPTGLEALLSDP
jgi:hypothetical protein